MNKNSLIFKISLISISLVLAAGPAASSLIPLMQQSFPSKSISSIELITTIPNLGILIFVLLSNISVKFIGKKNTVLLGLLIALISGIIPVFVENYTIILISRFFFGAGIGLFNALAVSLITELYSGNEQASLMGFQAAAGSIGSTLMTLLVGYFTRFGWQNSFLVYGFTMLPLVLFALFVNIPTLSNTENNMVTDQKKKERINLATVIMMLFAFVVYSLLFIVMLKTATLLVETGLGTPETAASILGSFTIAGIIVGLFYGKIFVLLKQTVLPLGLIGMGVGFVVILLSKSVAMITLGIILSGVFYGIAAPFMFMLVGQLAPKNSENLATAILLIGINLGVFLSPKVNSILGNIFGITNAADSFLVNGISLIGLGIISLFLLNIMNKKSKLITE